MGNALEQAASDTLAKLRLLLVVAQLCSGVAAGRIGKVPSCSLRYWSALATSCDRAML